MAENDNLNQDQQQDNPFDHPIKKNNWWLYILGGLCFAGLIIWFFIDWSYKDRNRDPEPEQTIEQKAPAQEVQIQENEQLQPVTVTATPEETSTTDKQ